MSGVQWTHLMCASNTYSTVCYWLLRKSADGHMYESMRVAVVPDSRSVAGHCSGFGRLSFTPEIPKGREHKVHEGSGKTAEDRLYFWVGPRRTQSSMWNLATAGSRRENSPAQVVMGPTPEEWKLQRRIFFFSRHLKEHNGLNIASVVFGKQLAQKWKRILLPFIESRANLIIFRCWETGSWTRNSRQCSPCQDPKFSPVPYHHFNASTACLCLSC